MNAPALIVRTSVDQNADGVLETIISDTYSADNSILTSVLDSNADGQADAVTSYTYNSSGNQTGLFFDNAADGSINYSFTTDYTTDTNGVLTVTAISSDGTGFDDVYVSKFDSTGNIIEEAVGTSDSGTSVTATYAYNASGQITEYQSERNGRTEYTYNAAGQISGFRLFSGSSMGDPFATGEYTYDAAGNFVQQEIAQDLNRFIETYLYDEENRLIETNSATSSRSFVGTITQTKYEYNAAGQVISFFNRSGNSGQTAATLYTYEYDAAGNFVKEVFDANNDGTPESITEYGYDSSGRITSQSLDTNADGTVDSIISYAYDDLITGGSGQSSAVVSEFDVAEADIFSGDLLAQITLGTSDMSPIGELAASSDLLSSPALLETESVTILAEHFL